MNIITDDKDVVDICKKIDANGRFAMDLEFIPERNFFPVLCLVQVATDAETFFIIDPLKVKDLSELWRRIADPNIQKYCTLLYKLTAYFPPEQSGTAEYL